MDDALLFNASKIIASGQESLKRAGRALLNIADNLDDSFAQAVQLLFQCEGRIIVTGIGKSGHIGNKIAATFASTGAPASFVHLSEASHGDLGMITSKDIVLGISNSGNSPEFVDVVGYLKRFGIKLIALTANQHSIIGKNADIVLLLPKLLEAGPISQVPTSSTTASLSLGDALAVALLEMKGFTVEDFGLLHPGGSIGAQLLRVADLMHAGDEMPLVSGNLPMRDIILAMMSKRFGCIGLIDDAGKFVGMITDGDLRRSMNNKFMTKKSFDVMTANPYVVSKDMLGVKALRDMNERRVNAAFVVDKNVPIGIIHVHDLLRAGLM